MTCPNIGNKCDNELRDYLHASIRPEFQSKADEYLKDFKEKIQKYINNLFDQIKQQKERNDFLLHMELYTSEKGNTYPEVDLIIKITKKIFHASVFERSMKVGKHYSLPSNPFFPQVLNYNCRTKAHFLITWTPNNLVIYPEKQTRSPSCPSDLPEKFQSGFVEKLRNNELNSLFKISIEGNTYKIPSALLAGRSDYFKTLIESGMRETINKSVEIKECSTSTFVNFLEFCYYGKIIDMNTKNLPSIVALGCFADRMLAPDLSNYCRDHLYQWANDNPITAETFKDYLFVTEKLDIFYYKNKLFTFVKQQDSLDNKNYEKVILGEEGLMQKYVDWLKT